MPNELLPTNIGFGTVVGRFGSAPLIAGDADGFPDFSPATGLTVTFTPSTAAVIDATASPAPVTIEMVPIVCGLDTQGYLVGGDGQRGVKLIATNDTDINPSGWTYSVTFLRGGAKVAAFRDFSMSLPAGVTKDIALTIPVPSSEGVSLSQAQAAEAAAVSAASQASAAAATAVAATVNKVDKGALVYNLNDASGVDPTGATDCTVALQSAFTAGITAGAKTFLMRGTYKVDVPLAQTLATFTGLFGITIDAAGATINNTHTYSTNTLAPVFLIDGGGDFRITLGAYVGATLATPTTELGYYGAILVRAINGANGVTVDAKITNARYGVQSGQYEDGAKGGCRNLTVKLRTSFCGYPLATYLASNVNFDIDADNVHRVAYIAGGSHIKGVARWRNQYIADTCLLLTDAITGVGTSEGCSNVDVTSIDKGSTVFQPSSMCAGITMSRVDPGTVFHDIKVKVHSVGTDTISTRVGGFRLISGAKAVQPAYPFNFEPTILFDNIDVSGVIDKSASTLAGCSSGDLSVIAYDTDTTHAATIRNFTVNNLRLLKSAPAMDIYFMAPGLDNPARFVGLHAPGIGLNVFTNNTNPVILEGSTVATLRISTSVAQVTGGSKVTIGAGSSYTSLVSNVTVANVDTVGPRLFAAGPPSTGTWAVGTEVKHKTPTAGAPTGWVCTVAGTPGTWVALPTLAGGSYLQAQIFQSGNYYLSAGTASTSNALANGLLRVSPWLQSGGAISGIGLEVTVAGSAGSVMRVCVYADNGAGYPGALVLDAGTVDATVVGVAELAVSQVLPAGLIWIGAVLQGAPTSQPTIRTQGGVQWPVSRVGTSLPTAGALISAYTQSGVTGTPPSTFSSAVAGSSAAPRIFVKAA